MSTVSAFLLRVPSLPIRAFNESRSSSSNNGESCKTQETHFSIIRMQSEAELKSPPLQQGTNALSHSRRGALWLGFSVGLLPLFESFCVQNQSAMAEGEVPCVLSTAPSGLAFCDRVVGTGSEATKGQLIKAHYVGKLENGKVFDSSYSRGEPLAFRVGVGEVIKGWDQGILGGDGIPPMLAGGKRTLKLPPELGYGMRGAGCKGASHRDKKRETESAIFGTLYARVQTG